MSFWSILSRRIKRVWLCMKRALPKALAVQSVLTFILVIFSWFYFGGSIEYDVLTVSMILLLTVTWSVFFFEQLARYGNRIFHRYDEELIGKAFANLSKEAAIFEEGLELLAEEDFRRALQVFTELDSDKYKKTREEQGVLSFSRGRCYQVMGMYPNAVIHYSKAMEYGFSSPILPLFLARSYVNNGEMNRAMKIYGELLDTDHVYAHVIRTDIGRAYLTLDDGENARKWYQEALDRHENYAEALGGMSIALLLLKRLDEGEDFFRLAMLNNIGDPEGYKSYYLSVRSTIAPEVTKNIEKGGEEQCTRLSTENGDR